MEQSFFISLPPSAPTRYQIIFWEISHSSILVYRNVLKFKKSFCAFFEHIVGLVTEYVKQQNIDYEKKHFKDLFIKNVTRFLVKKNK